MNGHNPNPPNPPTLPPAPPRPAPQAPPPAPNPSSSSHAWVILPLISAILFFLIYCVFANKTELDRFVWPPVLTNIIANASNTPPPASIVNLATNQPGPGPTKYSGAVSGANTNATGITQAAETSRKPDRLTRELSLRMLWAVSAVVFAALCFAVVAFALRIIKEVLNPSTRIMVYLGIGAVAAFLVLLPLSDGAVTSISGGRAAEQLFQIMGNDSDVVAAELNAQIRDSQMPALKEIRGLVTFVAAASKLGLAFVAIAACCVLMGMRHEQDAFVQILQPSAQLADQAKFKYERRVEITISLLQLTACALVAGVVEVYLLYNLASYHVNPLLQNDVRSFAQNLATISGLVYSGLLAAIYLPLVIGQRAIGRELLDSSGGKVTGAETRYMAQLDDANPKKAPMIEAILVVFSPVMVAFLTKLASTLMEHL